MIPEKTKYTLGRGCLITVTLVGLLLFFSTGCSEEPEKQAGSSPAVSGTSQPQAAQSVFRSVSVLEAQEMLRKREDLLLVDVRTPQEIKQMKIAGALEIPVGDVIRGKFVPPRDSPIMLVCAVGGRSYIAGKTLASRGYREIYNLDGGIEAWHRAGLPVVEEHY